MMTELWLSRAGLFIPLALAFVLFTLVLKWITIKKGEQLLSGLHALLHMLKIRIIKNEYAAVWAKNHPRLVVFLKARIDNSVFTRHSAANLGINYLIESTE